MGELVNKFKEMDDYNLLRIVKSELDQYTLETKQIILLEYNLRKANMPNFDEEITEERKIEDLEIKEIKKENGKNWLLSKVSWISGFIIYFIIKAFAGNDFYTISFGVILPFIIAGIIYNLFKKSLINNNIKISLSLISGHAAYLLYGLIYVLITKGILDISIIDLIVMISLIIWIYFKPNTYSVSSFFTFQILAISANIYYLLQFVNFNQTIFLILHIVLRTSSVCFLHLGYKEIKKINISVEKPNMKYFDDSRFSKLHKIYTDGFITKEEYENKRRSLIDEI